jgi:phosphoserine phosphatase
LTISQQYKDVKEKAEQLVPWLEKLNDNLAIITDGVDPEEEQRRTELSR